MEKLKVTMEDVQRFKILMEVIDKKLRVTDASAVLSLSYRHTLRLKDKGLKRGLIYLLEWIVDIRGSFSKMPLCDGT